jgi:hypothetical protein
MRFLVFIPNVSGGRPSFADVGLSCVTGDGEPAPEWVDLDSFPPADRPGRLYGWPDGLDGVPMYQPDLQSWIAAAPLPDGVDGLSRERGRYWLGLWKDSPPTAQDLERSRLVSGRMCLRASSGLWHVPSLLNLPCAIALDDETGLPRRVPKAEFSSWRADAAWGLDLTLKLLRGEALDWPLAEAFEAAVRLLQLNYRLPRELVHRLGLFDDETHIQAVLMHAADRNELDRAVAEIEAKKKAGQVMPAS